MKESAKKSDIGFYFQIKNLFGKGKHKIDLEQKIINFLVLGLFLACIIGLILFELVFKNRLIAQYKVGDKVSFGEYENTKMDWWILDKKDDEVLLLCNSVIDGKKYNEVYEECTWETSTIRKWLNKDFIEKSFNFGEKMSIPEKDILTNLDRKKTKDKVFLISSDELRMYVKELTMVGIYEFYVYNAAETEHARKAGVFSKNGYMPYCDYWLRDNGSTYRRAKACAPQGQMPMINEAGYDVAFANLGVRPAMWVKINRHMSLVKSVDE